MPKVNTHVASRKRRKKILKSTRGYFGNASRLIKFAKQAADRAGQFAFGHRRKKKGEFRKLWIVRINAACRPEGISYSRLISGLKAANIEMDRKQMSELAIHDPVAFKVLVGQAKAALK